MKEKTIEQRLVKAVKARGGICPKWVSPGFDGGAGQISFPAGAAFRIGGSEGTGQEAESLAGLKT